MPTSSYDSLVFETYPFLDSHKEYKVKYSSSGYDYNKPSYPDKDYQPAKESYLKPFPAHEVYAETTTTKAYPMRPPYQPPVQKPLPSATYAPPAYVAHSHKEEVQQGMPFSRPKQYEVNLIDYKPPTTKYYSTTTPYVPTTQSTYKPSPKYTAASYVRTTPYTPPTPPTPPPYTTTTEKYPSPEPHVPVQPTYSEKSYKPPSYEAPVPPPLVPFAGRHINYVQTTTPGYVTKPYVPPYFPQLPTANFQMNKYVPNRYDQKVVYGMPYSKKEVVKHDNVEYQQPKPPQQYQQHQPYAKPISMPPQYAQQPKSMPMTAPSYRPPYQYVPMKTLP